MVGATGICAALLLSGCSFTLPDATASAQDISEDPAPVLLAQAGQQTATFAGGCFWGMQQMFEQLRGVSSAQPGYAGGDTANPTYRDVSSGTTGYAESINVIYDPKIISYAELLTVFLGAHDSTQLNRQGGDIGPQYRSAIFTRTPAEQVLARQALAKPASFYGWNGAIVTQIAPLARFYRAEDSHLDYCQHNASNGYCQLVVAGEVRSFRRKFADKLKN